MTHDSALPDLKARYEQSPLTLAEIATLLKQQNIQTQKGCTPSITTVGYYLNGHFKMPENVRTALVDIFDHAAEYKAQLHHDATVAFQAEALQATSIHGALKSLRMALGLSHVALAKALTPHLPAGVAPSAPGIVYWETEPSQGVSHLPSRKIFAGTDPITAYAGVFRDGGQGAWFDAHAGHFRELLLHAMDTRQSAGTRHALRWNASDITRDRPAFWDDYIAAQKPAEAAPKQR